MIDCLARLRPIKTCSLRTSYNTERYKELDWHTYMSPSSPFPQICHSYEAFSFLPSTKTGNGCDIDGKISRIWAQLHQLMWQEQELLSLNTCDGTIRGCDAPARHHVKHALNVFLSRKGDFWELVLSKPQWNNSIDVLPCSRKTHKGYPAVTLNSWGHCWNMRLFVSA